MQEINISFLKNQIENKKILVAVSGGVDSMVLLSLMQKMNNDFNFYFNFL